MTGDWLDRIAQNHHRRIAIIKVSDSVLGEPNGGFSSHRRLQNYGWFITIDGSILDDLGGLLFWETPKQTMCPWYSMAKVSPINMSVDVRTSKVTLLENNGKMFQNVHCAAHRVFIDFSLEHGIHSTWVVQKKPAWPVVLLFCTFLHTGISPHGD